MSATESDIDSRQGSYICEPRRRTASKTLARIMQQRKQANESAHQSQIPERESSQERGSQRTYQRLMPTDTSDYTPSETETVTDNTNELINTLDDDHQEEAIRRRMDELYIAKQESMVRQQMAKLIQQKERLDEVKKEAEKIYTDSPSYVRYQMTQFIR